MRKLWLLFAQAVTVTLAVVAVLAAWKPQWWGSMRAREFAAASAPAPARVATVVEAPALAPHGTAANSFAAAVRRAAPAVVSITASKTGLR
ncbi:MAG TPA: hypothetical protein VIP05_16825, partial [Burkholderiaceae bacterium]